MGIRMIDTVGQWSGPDPAVEADARYADEERDYIQRAKEASCCDCNWWHVCPTDESIGWCMFDETFEDADEPVWRGGAPCYGWRD